jgi:hypothetical protein
MEPPGSRLTLVSEGFENEWPPAGWSYMTTGADVPWQQLGNQPHTGAYAAGVLYGAPGAFQDEWLVTPAINTMGLGTLLLEWWEYEVYWAGYGLRHSIAVSTTVPDDPAAFTEVLLMTPSTWTINQYAAPVTLSLADYVGYETVYIAFRYEGDWADDWYVDDVRVFEPFADDVMAVEVTPDGETFLAGTDVYPQLTVKNVGVNTETFDVEFTVDYNGTILYTETTTVVDLVSDEARTINFTMFTAEPGYYILTGTTLLAGDMDPDNDTAVGNNDCYSGERTPFGILYTEWGCGPCVAANVVVALRHRPHVLGQPGTVRLPAGHGAPERQRRAVAVHGQLHQRLRSGLGNLGGGCPGLLPDQCRCRFAPRNDGWL